MQVKALRLEQEYKTVHLLCAEVDGLIDSHNECKYSATYNIVEI